MVFFARIRRFFARLFGSSRPGGQHADPLIGVRQPNRGRPSGRSSGVALMEPDEAREAAMAVGRIRRT
jgi:hypothetical protein